MEDIRREAEIRERKVLCRQKAEIRGRSVLFPAENKKYILYIKQ